MVVRDHQKSASGGITKSARPGSDVRQAHVQGQRSQTFYCHHKAICCPLLPCKSHGQNPYEVMAVRQSLHPDVRVLTFLLSSGVGAAQRDATRDLLPNESQGFHASHTAGFQLQ